MGTFIKVDDNSLSGLNGLFVRILLEVEIRLPFKRILLFNNDEDSHVLLSYEKLFDVYFYYEKDGLRDIRALLMKIMMDFFLQTESLRMSH